MPVGIDVELGLFSGEETSNFEQRADVLKFVVALFKAMVETFHIVNTSVHLPPALP